ncbi:MAG: hypothetical protein IKZ71_05770 [Bacteroidales bacterium]|nr:hypothetical protein [Bacteroidales bacterium]
MKRISIILLLFASMLALSCHRLVDHAYNTTITYVNTLDKPIHMELEGGVSKVSETSFSVRPNSSYTIRIKSGEGPGYPSFDAVFVVIEGFDAIVCRYEYSGSYPNLCKEEPYVRQSSGYDVKYTYSFRAEDWISD